MADEPVRRGRLTFSTRDIIEAEEEDALLPDDEENPDADGCYGAFDDPRPNMPNPHANLPVYTTLHRIRRDIMLAIDDPYSLEQLRDPRMNIAVVRPLVDKFYAMKDISIIYCLLVNRTQFLRQSGYAHHQSVNITRALLCELVANRVLRRFNDDNEGRRGLLILANVLVAPFDPFQNAPPEIMPKSTRALRWVRPHERKLPALEIAIISESKTLLSSSACQRVVNAIYEGRIVYTPSTFMDILPDRYKRKPITIYDPRKAPLLNQYRLIVPRTRNFMEIIQFVILLLLYVLVMADRDPTNFTTVEVAFDFYTAGWCLDQFASILEHGWGVYTQNLWSFLDVTFIAIYIAYMVMRLHAWRTDDLGKGWQAMDTLAMGAPVLVPRLAFNLMSENMLFVSLRAMMANFTVLTLLAVWCFAGFLLSMFWLSNGVHHILTISKWMLWLWFGLDGTGVQRSTELHWLLGPVLMVTFTFLGNTLFLTILVSMLSSTFAKISSNAAAEIQFRRAVLTLEGVKSDAIFAYLPPFNIVALCILLPLKFVLTPRWFHKVNVFAVRALNAPLLLIIGYLERRALWSTARQKSERNARFKHRLGLWTTALSVHGDIQAVFEADPPPSIQAEIDADDDLNLGLEMDPGMSEQAFVHRIRRKLSGGNVDRDGAADDMNRRDNQGSGSTEGATETANGSEDAGTLGRGGRPRMRTRKSHRRDSMAPFEGLTQHLKEMLRESGEDHDGPTQARLDGLESSVKNIEEMMLQLIGRTGGGSEKRESDADYATSIEPLEEGSSVLNSERHE